MAIMPSAFGRRRGEGEKGGGACGRGCVRKGEKGGGEWKGRSLKVIISRGGGGGRRRSEYKIGKSTVCLFAYAREKGGSWLGGKGGGLELSLRVEGGGRGGKKKKGKVIGPLL